MIKQWLKHLSDEVKLGIYSTGVSSYKKSPTQSGSVILPAASPGGVGDDAMVNGTINALTKINSASPINILAPSNHPEEFSFHPAAKNIKAWSNWKNPINEAKLFAGFSNSFVLGADIMDGHYSYSDAIRRIKFSHHASKLGLDSRIIGFSLNESPHPKVIEAFRALDNNTSLCLRDPISFERARKLLPCNIRCTADLAFLLSPTDSKTTQEVEDFSTRERDKGNTIIGMNLHSLFSRSSTKNVLPKLVDSLASIIKKHKDCSFVLIPHDFRSFVDDRKPLSDILNKLSKVDQERVFSITAPLRAAEIKSISGKVDAVITGRMHLAIAALGAGTPVLGIVYQGKFEGTFSYFEMESDCTISPESAADESILDKKFIKWRSSFGLQRNRITKNLPKVLELSFSNLSD